MLNELNRITRGMLGLHGYLSQPLERGEAVVGQAHAATVGVRVAGAGAVSPVRMKARFLALQALVAWRGRA
jgi:hypothetical protein